ncbi:hypothetical protein [Sulfitobacter sp. M368]|uniref:hypothetical protein n=1 Tax=Sulfitobacter sp. M368 TaxID=2867021 RepID=UPI0021A842B9|nr:hypothetical protein [Sulfitobacter sp. M368]UWR16378.1 hypothetical protein K3754_05675 [Sulfitobacter sp. M368]
MTFANPPARTPAFCKSCRQQLTSVAAVEAGYCDRPECATRMKIDQSGQLAKSQEEQYQKWLEITHARTAPVIMAAAQEIGEDDLDEVAHGLAPYVDIPVVPLPAERRSAFEAHLRAAVRESFEATDASEEPPERPEDDPEYARRLAQEAPDPMALNAACIACQGDCCLQGGTRHAFIKKNVIDYFRWSNPEATADEIVQNYLDHIPENSTSGSCVYHGVQGCTLPRNYRANICNSFQCRFRLTLFQDYVMKPGSAAVVAGISHDHTEDPAAGAPYLRVVSVSEEGDVTIHSHLTLPALPGANS